MSHVTPMSHGARMNESRYTCAISMDHGTHMNESRYTYESCHIYKFVMAHV